MILRLVCSGWWRSRARCRQRAARCALSSARSAQRTSGVNSRSRTLPTWFSTWPFSHPEADVKSNWYASPGAKYCGIKAPATECRRRSKARMCRRTVHPPRPCIRRGRQLVEKRLTIRSPDCGFTHARVREAAEGAFWSAPRRSNHTGYRPAYEAAAGHANCHVAALSVVEFWDGDVRALTRPSDHLGTRHNASRSTYPTGVTPPLAGARRLAVAQRSKGSEGSAVSERVAADSPTLTH